MKTEKRMAKSGARSGVRKPKVSNDGPMMMIPGMNVEDIVSRTIEEKAMEGNQMSNSFDKMHDALVKLKMYMRYETCSKSFCIDSLDLDAFKVIQSALDLPRRNCDVGTAEGQTKRFSDFCAAHRHTDLPRCAGCPLENTPPDTGCSFAWMQIPYEEGRKGKRK